ncbi:MAG TPA: hypothetical protein ENL03_01245, partial [Phycisphaerae bacterium]|nr:hypothetical protein [Phycisphaerae bacterium]
MKEVIMIGKSRNLKSLLAGILLAALMTVGGCMTTAEYRKQADEVAAGIIAKAQQRALGRTEEFSIEAVKDSLRQKLLKNQSLPMCCMESRDLDKQLPEDPPVVVDKTPLVINLTDALGIAARNSRDYQSRKEDVFRAALALDLEADRYRMTYAGLIESLFNLN